MGSFLPVFLAFILNSYGIYIFLEPKLPGCGPFLSLIIFMFAAFVLLWDIRLYPKSLRKLGPCTSNIIEVNFLNQRYHHSIFYFFAIKQYCHICLSITYEPLLLFGRTYPYLFPAIPVLLIKLSLVLFVSHTCHSYILTTATVCIDSLTILSFSCMININF